MRGARDACVLLTPLAGTFFYSPASLVHLDCFEGLRARMCWKKCEVEFAFSGLMWRYCIHDLPVTKVTATQSGRGAAPGTLCPLLLWGLALGGRTYA